MLGPIPSGISAPKNVYASNLNSSPHLVDFWTRSSNANDPIVANRTFTWTDVDAAAFIIYAENDWTEFNPQKGSLVFVRKAPLPTAGGGQPSGI